ncbi:MAG: hypothetical protein ACR2NB_10045 [Solirubrobacteraceae bacterium]
MAGSADVVLATVRDFTDRSGAVRVVVLLDRGPDREAPVLECEPGGPLTMGQGEDSFVVPPSDLVGIPPLSVRTPKPVPPTALDVDPVRGQVAAPLGVVEGLADAVTDLARVLGGRTVAVVEFATRSGEPLSIAARPGEPVVLAIGEQQFELPTRARG